jgi:hypothetical protein
LEAETDDEDEDTGKDVRAREKAAHGVLRLCPESTLVHPRFGHGYVHMDLVVPNDDSTVLRSTHFSLPQFDSAAL